MKLLFVGQAPSRETDGQPPFVGKCGAFLAQLLGTTQEQMLLDHDFANVINRYPGKGVGGDLFPIKEAMAEAVKMLPYMRGRTVVLLGNNVARAFQVKKFAYMSWYSICNPENHGDVVVPKLTVVPHPSQVNRYWNNPISRNLVSKFLQALATDQKTF